MPKSKGRRPRKPTRKPAGRRPPGRAGEAAAVADAGRYTAPLHRQIRVRPNWHRVAGIVFIVFGLGIFVVNDLEWVGVHLMPGGHREAYALIGIVVAASSLWWFGLLDRPPARR